jgi:hypothetical protein
MPQAIRLHETGSECALDSDRTEALPIGRLALAASILMACVQTARVVLALDGSRPKSLFEELVTGCALFGSFALFLPAVVASVGEIIARSARGPWSRTLLMIVIGGALFAWGEHLDSIETAAVRADPVAHAVERYVVAHGSPPVSLEALVPAYLEELPARLTRSYGPLQYACTQDARGWSLAFEGGESSFGFAAGLEYQPDRSADSYDGHFMRCGLWAGWCDD